MQDDMYYALQAGALWEFDKAGWGDLLECIGANRGYALSQFGRCLTMQVPDLGKMSQGQAKDELCRLD